MPQNTLAQDLCFTLDCVRMFCGFAVLATAFTAWYYFFGARRSGESLTPGWIRFRNTLFLIILLSAGALPLTYRLRPELFSPTLMIVWALSIVLIFMVAILSLLTRLSQPITDGEKNLYEGFE